MTDTFISYSRKDTNFARRLFDALEAAERDAWIDWDGIASAAPDFLAEIYEGIETASTYLIIMTPDSLKSEICNLEIAHAISHHKRIIPVLHVEVMDDGKLIGEVVQEWYGSPWEDTARKNWETLNHINWLFFRQTDDFDTAFEGLIETLDSDLDYDKFHARLTTRAREWEVQHHSDDFVLRGDDLTTAEGWLAISEHKTPSPTSLHQEYIKASVAVRERELAEAREQQARELELQKAAAQRLRFLLAAAVLFVIVAVGLSIFAFAQRNNAQTEARNAEIARQASDANAATATVALGESQHRGTLVAEQAATSDANLREAQRQQSLFYADFAREEHDNGNYQEVLTWALESLQFHPEVSPPESRNQLLTALSAPLEVVSLYHRGGVWQAKWSPDESRIVTISDDNINCTQDCNYLAYVWDATTGEELFRIPHKSRLREIKWNPDGSRFVSRTENSIQVFDAITGSELAVLLDDSNYSDPLGAKWSEDGRRILTWGDSTTARVWELSSSDGDTVSIDEVAALQHATTVTNAAWNAEETLILTQGRFGVMVWDTQSWHPQLELPEDSPARQFVYGAAWNRDETRILTWGEDATARILDANTGEQLFAFRHEILGPFVRGFEVQFDAQWSGDGSRVLTWGADDTVRVWNAETGSEIFVRQHNSVIGAAWDAQSRRILTWGRDGIARILDAEFGSELSIIEHDSAVMDAMWHNVDENRIFTWTEDNEAAIWELSLSSRSYTLLAEFPLTGDTFFSRSADWSADGTHILSWAGINSRAGLWEVESGVHLASFPHDGDSYGLRDAAWNSDGSRVLTQYRGGIQIWDTETQETVFTFDEWVHMEGASWNPDESRILIWSNGSKAFIWDANTWEEVAELKHASRISGMKWSADGSRILSWDGSGSAYIWDADTGQKSIILPHQFPVEGAAWNANESRILTWSNASFSCEENCLHQVHIWQLPTANGDDAEELVALQHELQVSGAAWNADGSYILSWTNPYTYSDCKENCLYQVQVWQLSDDSTSAEEIVTIQHDEVIRAAAWIGDTSLFAWWAWDGTIEIWNAVSGELHHPLSHFSPYTGVYDIEVSADASRILAWGSSSTVFVWDVATGEPLATLQHDDSIPGAKWNADETRILTWVSDGTVHFWELSPESSDGAVELLRLHHDGTVYNASWNTDEKRILSWSRDGTIRIWEAEFEVYLEQARAIQEHTIFSTPTPSPTPQATPATSQ